jgi:hypothetical protein
VKDSERGSSPKVVRSPVQEPAPAARPQTTVRPKKLPNSPVVTDGEAGPRPRSLVDAVAAVMGGESLSAQVILARLRERGWAPGASNPIRYVGYVLQDCPERFVQVRDKFRLRPTPAMTAREVKAIQIEGEARLPSRPYRRGKLPGLIKAVRALPEPERDEFVAFLKVWLPTLERRPG